MEPYEENGKKIISILLVISMLASLSTPAFAVLLASEEGDETDDKSLPYEVPGGSLSFDAASGNIVGYSGEPTSLVIPAVIGDAAVTGIDTGVFSGCTTLTDVTLPEEMETIGNYAFRDCTSLASVTLPANYTSINSGMFFGCTEPYRIWSLRHTA